MKMILRRIEQKLERYFNSKEQQIVIYQAPVPPAEWLDKFQVMRLLSVSESTFRRLAKELDWKMRLVGKRKYYLKSSILESE